MQLHTVQAKIKLLAGEVMCFK